VSDNRTPAEIAQQSVNLLNQLLGDPRTAPDAEKLIQTINPKAEFPYRQQREAVLQPVMSELEKERARVAALEEKWNAREAAEAARETKRQEDELLARMEQVKSKRGFSDDAMQRVMDRMRQNNNPDVEAAAAWVAESAPKAPPASGYDYLPNTVDAWGSASGDEAWKSLHEDPQKWLTSELRSIVRDPEFTRLGGG
jgi:hypothetical protein